MTDVFQELAEPSRRKILAALLEGQRNVSQLVSETGMRQPNVSNHLARLRERGILSTARDGRQIYYTLADSEIETLVRSSIAVEAPTREATDLRSAADSYFRAAIEGDEPACRATIDHLIRQNVHIVTIFNDVIAQAMTRVGQEQDEKQLTIAQEHMASAISERMISRVALSARQMPTSSIKAVTGCVQGNYHALGIRMLTDLLSALGIQCTSLGSNVPTAEFVRSVAKIRPHLVMISCGHQDQFPDCEALLHDLRALRDADSDLVIGLGGPAVRQLRKEKWISLASFVADDIREFYEQIVPSLELTR